MLVTLSSKFENPCYASFFFILNQTSNVSSHFSKCSQHLPSSLTSLTLNDNELSELRDLAHIAHLSRLEQLSLASNPCIEQPEDPERHWDYRPYAINWCLGLRALDGVPVGAKESLKVSLMIYKRPEAIEEDGQRL